MRKTALLAATTAALMLAPFAVAQETQPEAPAPTQEPAPAPSDAPAPEAPEAA